MLEMVRSLSGADAVFVAAGFVLVLAAWIAGVTFWQMRVASRVRAVDVRLGLAEGESGAGRKLRLWHEGRQVTLLVPGQKRARSLLERLDVLIKQAGWNTSGSSLLLIVAVTMLLVLFLAAAGTGRLLAGVISAAVVPLVAWAYLRRCIVKRTTLFEGQFLDALGLAARSLRAGHPLSGSFRLIAQELAAPVGPMFGRICQQQELGMDLTDALGRAALECNSSELDLFAASVSIQLRTGGNLADLMDRLAEVIRERMRILRRVRVLTAQTQFSKCVLMALPFITFAILNLLNPTYMAPLYSTRFGQMMLLSAGAMLFLGGWIMNRMTRLQY